MAGAARCVQCQQSCGFWNGFATETGKTRFLGWGNDNLRSPPP